MIELQKYLTLGMREEPRRTIQVGSLTKQSKYTRSRLNAMRKDKLFALCLKHFGSNTTSVYSYYTKAELIDNLLTVEINESPK